MFATREASAYKAPRARVGRREIALAMSWLEERGHEQQHEGSIEAYVCGPRGMPEAVADECGVCGIPSEAVRYEKWW